MADTLIATPQVDELGPLLDGFHRLGHPSSDRQVGTMSCHAIPSLDLLVAVAGHGKAQFALQTQYVVDQTADVHSLICVGAAGRLTGNLTLGDLVVGTATVEHDYKLRFVPASAPCHEPSSALLDAFRETAGCHRFSFDVHFGRIASGDEDIVEPRRARELREATGALCVAWEGSGGARVARFNGLGFLEVRGVTDGADQDAASSFHENVARAMSNAAELLVCWKSSG